MKRILHSVLLVLIVCALPLLGFAQHTITGTVTSKTDRQPIPGATVKIKNSNTGTQTNADGRFTLTASAGNTLEISFVGFATQDLLVGASREYNVIMSLAETALTEIVVTSQGIKKEKRSLGYAVATINSSEIGENSSPINALQGKVAGLNITSGNAPGSASRIVLRGPTSFTGNNQPVFIIDGVPVSNDNERNTDFLNDQVDYGNRGNDLNPNEIESVTVLKGPAAAALYGSIASNGAILIVTKKGKKNSRAQINFSTSYQLSSILKLPDFQNKFGEGNLDAIPNDPRENFSWGEPFDGKERPFGQVINGKQQLKKYVALPHNVRDFFDKGQTWNNNLSLTGGNDKSTYYLSVAALNNKGIVPGTNFNKYNIRLSGTSDFSEKFSSSATIGYSNISSKLPLGGQSNSVYTSIFQQPRDAPITSFKDLSNPYNGTFTGPDGTQYYGYYGAYTKNPYFLLQNYTNTNTVDRITGNFSVSYKPLEGLDITERIGADIYTDRRYEQGAKYNFVPFDPFYVPNNWTDNGKYSQDIFNYMQFNHDLIITYGRKIAKDLDMKLLAGNNVRMEKRTELFATTNSSGGLIIPGFYSLTNSNGPVSTTNLLSNKRLYGFYFSADFEYKNMLFLGVTGRNDISSTLPTNNNSYFYPSVNGAFVFTELFKKQSLSDVLSFGKIRASYAKVGADANPYLLSTSYSSTAISSDFGQLTFPITSNGTLIPGFTRNDQIGNSKIKPEFTQSAELGLELSFFRDKLGLDVSVYNTKSTNQIVRVPIAPITGYTSIIINTGEMNNKGLEIGVRGIPVNTSYGLKVEVFGTYNRVKSNVVSISPGLTQISIGNGITSMGEVAAVGKPYGTFYGQGFVTDSASGRIIVDKSTGLPLNNGTNYYKTYLPDYMASLGTTISFKGIILRVLFDTKQGGQFYSNTKSTISFGGYTKETAFNDRKDYVWPNSVYADANGKYVNNTSVTFHPYTYWTSVAPSAAYLIDASYIKLREASLQYDLPHQWIKRTGIGNLSVTIYGNNLFIWTPKSNQFADPEINGQGAANVQGYEFLSNPSLRNYGIKLNATL
ncbi:TonB-linked SusC/RagA family outer membrane protein [Chitinophaga niastensis]|uniref:TonB-linked SusC/RagA family outer membrane protein n=1 Tax=Chitinophaga niastensis TaxID=536980 RepID=A0A2P8HC99_CHINA|nr:SusC/RagA family TonB-linked outer membrane protein [Chitinophaga niastensis]PSL43824.1 TonB-linked SusC/RagA family outer membrane protein [Chitinophaga niastensis]